MDTTTLNPKTLMAKIILGLREEELLNFFSLEKTRGVSHCGLPIYTLKKGIKAKEELWKLNYFTMQKKIIFKKSKPKKKKNIKILQDIIITLITNLKFQHKPKYHLSKIPISK